MRKKLRAHLLSLQSRGKEEGDRLGDRALGLSSAHLRLEIMKAVSRGRHSGGAEGDLLARVLEVAEEGVAFAAGGKEPSLKRPE